MNTSIPMLVISGSLGSRKTTVLSEASDLLSEAKIAHAAIDLDWLSVIFPQQEQYGELLMLKNLAAIWPAYVAAGAQRLIVARVVEDRSVIVRYSEAVPDVDPVVCRLVASVETMKKRLLSHEPGMFQASAIARSKELADILERNRAEEFTAANDTGRTVTEVAAEVLSRADWL